MPKFKTIALAALLATTCLYTQAQRMSNIDFDEIKAVTTDSASAYFYPKLMARFVNQNIPLSDKQYFYLYYGSRFDNRYNTYKRSFVKQNLTLVSDTLFDYLNQKKYKEAIPYAMKFLKNDPLNIQVISMLGFCYDELGDKVSSAKYLNMRNSLIRAILESGDGKGRMKPYVLMRFSDEYPVIDYLGLEMKDGISHYEPVDAVSLKRPVVNGKKTGLRRIYFHLGFRISKLDKGL